MKWTWKNEETEVNGFCYNEKISAPCYVTSRCSTVSKFHAISCKRRTYFFPLFLSSFELEQMATSRKRIQKINAVVLQYMAEYAVALRFPPHRPCVVLNTKIIRLLCTKFNDRSRCLSKLNAAGNGNKRRGKQTIIMACCSPPVEHLAFDIKEKRYMYFTADHAQVSDPSK